MFGATSQGDEYLPVDPVGRGEVLGVDLRSSPVDVSELTGGLLADLDPGVAHQVVVVRQPEQGSVPRVVGVLGAKVCRAEITQSGSAGVGINTGLASRHRSAPQYIE